MQYFLKAKKSSHIFMSKTVFTSEIASDIPENEANRSHLLNNDETSNKKTAATIQKVQGDT